MLKLDPLPKVITFDCYGTLVQWHRAVRQAAATVLSSHMAEASQERIAGLADRVREIATQHQQQSPFREYEAVLNASLNEALSEAGYKATSADLETLLATLGKIEPHPEVPAALSQLRERYRIGIVSNTSDNLIAGTVNAIGTPIDFVITAQQAQAYKPDHRLFLHAHSVMGVTKDETIHVAMGQFSDLKVCHELGIRSVWIDREGEPLHPSWKPDAVLKDLSELSQLLTPS
ncbi:MULTISPECIES: haloacid dehalogenase type II [unclassified Pseudomonas]|uniref:haloacid dehalogenase type II n=1 Tax=unclassified Pseudomonas TaxID=196821 RepID=UPI0025F7D9FD|nr:MULTISPECIES: haloacid dehalogenase type II [unclassified Pseudomonas]